MFKPNFGKLISDQLDNVIYKGVQRGVQGEPLAMLFYDKITRRPFSATTLRGARTILTKMRNPQARMNSPLTDATGKIIEKITIPDQIAIDFCMEEKTK
jgi:hypothetical protein